MSTTNLKKESNKIAVVTGSSSGVGFVTSLLLAKNGYHTFATVRNLEKAKSLRDISDKGDLPITVLELDVKNDNSVNDAIQGIIDKEKRIDAVVNNAGYSLMGALEDLSMDEIKAQFETNIFGTIRMMKAVLPIMREQHNGTIVNVSSMAGKVGFPLLPIYSSTKFALEGVSESVRLETDAFGIKIVIIEPGTIKSNFASNAIVGRKVIEPSSPYAPQVQAMQKATERIINQGIQPQEVAEAILNAVTSENPELRYPVGNDAIHMIEARKGMSDQEFGVVVKQHLLAQ